MNRTLVVVLAVAVLCSGAVATAAAFTDGDEVVDGSEVYLDAADSENGEQYIQIDRNDEIRLQFDTLPPGSQTRVDDLFMIGFAGYEDSDATTTVQLESTDDRLTLTRMDTGESFGSGTVELQPGESVLFGAVVSTDTQSFSSSIELEVDVPDTDGGSSGGGTGGSGSGGSTGGSNGGNSGTGGGGEDAGDEEGVGDDESDNGGGDTPDESTGDGDGVAGEPNDDDTAAGDDATDPSVDTDTDPGGDLIELAGFGTPFSLIVMSVLAVILSLSYAFRLEIVAGGLTNNTGGPE
ncbi:hypothetical protein GLW36_12675 [Halorubrum terrestre]|uniref:Uncharacterized protein n=1 Tax=Halorubrum distributum TaxID=29283 RepID=A0A6B1IFP0_9EURY|nr:hypothetical protein [Halorubrum terrestre]MYL17493.1 hypothetical protein [Halorubrum terrestre]